MANAGIDITAALVTYTPTTPLKLCIEYNSVGNLKFLLGRGVELQSRGSMPLLHWVAQSRRSALVAMVVEAGADVNAYCNGATALHAAFIRLVGMNIPDTTKTVAALIEHGADPTLRDRHNLTAADLAREAFPDDPPGLAVLLAALTPRKIEY